MAAAPPLPPTREAVLEQLQAMANSTQNDNFRIKVSHKVLGAPGNLVLSVAGARVVHAAEPETWVPQLIGGSGKGVFDFEVTHESSPAVSIGKILGVKIDGQTRIQQGTGAVLVNWLTLEDPDYTGPVDIRHPQRPAAPPTLDNNGQTLLSIAQGAGAQPAPVPGNGPQVWGPAPVAPVAVAATASYSDELVNRDRDLNRRERALEVLAIQRDGELKLQRLEMGFNSKLDQLTAELRAARTALERPVAAPAPVVMPAPVEPKPSALDKVLTSEVVMGVITMMMNSSKDARAESRAHFEAIAKMQADSAKETRELLFKLSEKKDDGAGGNAKMLEMMMGMQSAQFGQMTNMFDLQMRVMKELQPPDEKEESVLKMGLRGLLDYLAASQSAAGRQQLSNGYQLPGGEQTAPGAEGARGEAPEGEAPPEEEDDPPPDSMALTRIKSSIISMRAVDEVASLVVNSAANDDEFQRELGEYKGDMVAMFDDHLGEWAEENLQKRMPYVNSLITAINNMATQRQNELRNASAKEAQRRGGAAPRKPQGRRANPTTAKPAPSAAPPNGAAPAGAATGAAPDAPI